MRRPIAVIGPTAAGKSALAMDLAEGLDGEIINADALQVYRGLDIGTDKPTPEMRTRVPHHLVDILDPEETYSAGEFSRRARLAIREIQERGKVPIVVGGSGLYQRALFEGISSIPAGSPEIRGRLERRLELEGLAVLYSELAEHDPETASRLAPGDRQRILRGLEVWIDSGRPLSSWIRDMPFGERRLDALRIGLTLPRSILYDRISDRVRIMMAKGLKEEVLGLLEHGIDPAAPAFQAIGYRQMVRHIRGEASLEDVFAEIVRTTRRYAKRQLTWFRREEGIRWVPALNLPDLYLVEQLRSGGGSWLNEQT